MKRGHSNALRATNEGKMKMVKMKVQNVELIRFAKCKLYEPNMMGKWILNSRALQP